jgi:hypothetical protein
MVLPASFLSMMFPICCGSASLPIWTTGSRPRPSARAYSAEKARLLLKHDDEERQKWALFLYGIDISDPALYDLTVNVSAMGVEDSAELLAQAARLACFKATEESMKRMQDQALAAEIRAALFDFPMAGVAARDGRAHINVKAPEDQTEQIRSRIELALASIPDLGEAVIRVDPFY